MRFNYPHSTGIYFFLDKIILLFLAGITLGNILFINHCLASEPSSRYSNILLITIDTLRADHLACYGYSKIKTPVIDTLAKEGILFQQVYTPVPVTFPSHVSILTGLYPPFHGVRNNGNFTLNDEIVTVTEILSKHGYQTAAFIGAYVLDSFYGLDQGFQHYDDNFSGEGRNEETLFQERRAEKVTDSALKWIEKHHKLPFFIWIHYFDPHDPYNAPSPFGQRYSQSPYDGEIAYADYSLGCLFSKLREWGIYDKTMVILTSDHGESLGEHGESTHGVFIYDVTLQVPLIVKDRSLDAFKGIVSKPVRIIDIVPTLLEILHITYNGPMHGESFLDLIHNKSEKKERILYCESYLPYHNHGWSPLIGLRTTNWKYIKAPKPELYNLKEDYQERENQIQKYNIIRNNMEKELQKLLLSIRAPESKRNDEIVPEQEDLEKLKSLGYIFTTSPKQQKGPLADPKDKIELLENLNRGLAFLLNDDPNQAIIELRTFIDKNPGNIFAHLILGSAYCKKKLYDSALKEFKKVVQIDSAYMDIHTRIACIYEIQGLYDKAIEEYKLAIYHYPKCEENYDALADIYLKKGQYDETINLLKEAVKLKSDFISAHNNLGLAYGKKKKYALAVKEFHKALITEPSMPEIYNNLGCVYLELGILLKSINMNNLPISSQELMRIYKQIPELENDPSVVFDLAQRAFENALKIDDHYKEARINLGLTYLNLGLKEKAEAEYQLILEEDPTDIRSRLNLAIIYLQSQLIEEGMKHLLEVLKLEPTNLAAHYYLGSAYMKLGQTDKAIEEFHRMIEIKPESPEAHYSLGKAYQSNGQIKQAINEYQKVLKVNPNHIRARDNLSLLLKSYH